MANPSRTDLLRALPQVEEMLQLPEVSALLSLLPRSVLADMPAIDLTELNTDVENINAVTTEYAEQLWNGGSGSESYMAVYNDYVSKLQAAGLETVRAYIQAQIDAHLAK